MHRLRFLAFALVWLGAINAQATKHKFENWDFDDAKQTVTFCNDQLLIIMTLRNLCQRNGQNLGLADSLRVMSQSNPFKYFKTNPAVIKLAIMYYMRFPLSLRQVEDILNERGIDITHETVRFWCDRFGPTLAKDIKKRRAGYYSNWRWHLDEVFVKINGENFYLWRAVDHEGVVLECYASKKRDKRSALKMLKKLLKEYGYPAKVVTDNLPSYKAALKQLNLAHRQTTGRYANNQAENFHRHFRRRERSMYRFRSLGSLQKFTSYQAPIHNLFAHQRHIETRTAFKKLHDQSLADWLGLMAA